ncbi:MAG: pantoate--beta-alanine ligase [Anaerolineaceae bacterium]|nr:pantoate--beta-alanine ligase [Anaerolineaceae bacterium]
MQVVETVPALRAARAALDGRVGLVTTMGALHAGHLALVEQARAENDAVLVTIFVNPTQFAPHEDLSKYPRDLPRDLAMLEAASVDLVFTPVPQVMYPPGFQTVVEVTEISQGLEGEHRPGHFQGVATVVAKLFNLAQADRAYFGQKDAQQAAVIRTMARDLNFPLEVIICPTVRESDGLAMSSRNVYLTPEQRRAAPVLYRALQAAGKAYADGERRPDSLQQCVLDVLTTEPLAQIEYVSVCDARTLQNSTTTGDMPLLVSMAVKIGLTRLIDNCLLPNELNTRDGLTDLLGGVASIPHI